MKIMKSAQKKFTLTIAMLALMATLGNAFKKGDELEFTDKKTSVEDTEPKLMKIVNSGKGDVLEYLVPVGTKATIVAIKEDEDGEWMYQIEWENPNISPRTIKLEKYSLTWCFYSSHDNSWQILRNSKPLPTGSTTPRSPSPAPRARLNPLGRAEDKWYEMPYSNTSSSYYLHVLWRDPPTPKPKRMARHHGVMYMATKSKKRLEDNVMCKEFFDKTKSKQRWYGYRTEPKGVGEVPLKRKKVVVEKDLPFKLTPADRFTLKHFDSRRRLIERFIRESERCINLP